jgi:hypothetical protein
MIAVVLLLLTATALAHGALLMARAELSAARAYAGALGDASALRVRMQEALAAGLDADLARVPVWGEGPVREPTTQAPGPLRLRRLAPESWWLERAGTDGSSRRIGTPGLLLWWLDPVTRIRALGAVVTVGPDAPVRIDGSIERAGFGRADPPLATATCEAEIGSSFEGVVPDAVAVAADAFSPALGLLSFEELLTATPVEVAGTGTPLASEWAGTCSTDEPWNWGDPERPTAPCGAHLAVRRAVGTLHVTGGSGQAVLVVDGDLVLSGDTRLFGMVVATGAVMLLDRSELHGVAVAEGGLSVAAGAVVRGSACWAARGLRTGVTEWMPSPVRVPGLPPVAP